MNYGFISLCSVFLQYYKKVITLFQNLILGTSRELPEISSSSHQLHLTFKADLHCRQAHHANYMVSVKVAHAFFHPKQIPAMFPLILQLANTHMQAEVMGQSGVLEVSYSLLAV